MARTELTVTRISRSGVEVAGVAGTADGHMFKNDGNVLLRIANGDVSPRTVTIPTPATVKGLTVEDISIAIPASDRVYIGPFPTGLFNQTGADAGKVYVDFEAGQEAQFTVEAYSFYRSD